MQYKILLLLAVAAGLSAQAQNRHVEHDSLYSQILQEERTFDVVLPQAAVNGKDSAEAVFVLDGLSDFTQLETTFLAGEGFIPQNLLLVGINNIHFNGTNTRDRDFTPTNTGGIAGGAAAFLNFLKTELMPYIIRKYHAKKSGHTLYGGSLGGLFTIYTLLHEPSLFTSYMAVDPSLWWDNYVLDKQAAAALSSLKYHNTLWMVGRAGSAYHHMGIAAMDTLLQKIMPAGLQWRVAIYDNDTHYSSNFKGFYEGLKFSYGGFYASTGGYPSSQMILAKPSQGQVLKNKPFTVLCFNLSAGDFIRYSIDGKQPSLASPLLSGEITNISVEKDAVLILRSFCMRDEYVRQDSILIKVGDVFHPVILPKDAKPGGLLVTPAGLVVTETGFLAIPADNYYTFSKDSDGDSSSVWLGSVQIFGAPHFEKGGSYLAWLKKGYYPLRINYTIAQGRQPLFIQPQGFDQCEIPSSILYK